MMARKRLRHLKAILRMAEERVRELERDYPDVDDDTIYRIWVCGFWDGYRYLHEAVDGLVNEVAEEIGEVGKGLGR